jgi:hypothetical protein
MSFKEKCIKAGVNYVEASYYKRCHPELTEEQVIVAQEKLFKQKCKRFGINYSAATNYKLGHPELTENEVLSFYIPNSYVNLDDDLIIDGKIIDFGE